MQAVAKHAGAGLSFVPLQVPKVAWQPQLASVPFASHVMLVQAVVHCCPLGLAQVPGVRHCASASA